MNNINMFAVFSHLIFQFLPVSHYLRCRMHPELVTPALLAQGFQWTLPQVVIVIVSDYKH